MGKKAKKIVLNQLNEVVIQWLHLTTVLVSKIEKRQKYRSESTE